MYIHYLLFLGMLIPLIWHLQTNTFPSSGNVGIGVDTPRLELDVIEGIRTKNITIDDPLQVL